MACRTYRPHIQLQIGRRWDSLIGWFDVSALGLHWWECEGHGARGDGKTPKEAYDAWYRDFIRPYRNNSVFMAAYRAANTPR